MHHDVVGVHVTHKVRRPDRTSARVLVREQLLVVGEVGHRDGAVEGDQHKLRNLVGTQASRWPVVEALALVFGGARREVALIVHKARVVVPGRRGRRFDGALCR